VSEASILEEAIGDLEASVTGPIELVPGLELVLEATRTHPLGLAQQGRRNSAEFAVAEHA
jgi:hypothetical protein